MHLSSPSCITSPESWLGRTLQENKNWIVFINPNEILEINNLLDQWRKNPTEYLQYKIQKSDLPNLSKRFLEIRSELEGGRGFFLLRGLPVNLYSTEEAKVVFWVLAKLLGEPQGQDKLGSLMHSVTNTGLKVAENSEVRSYQTDDELTFHNDGGDAFMLLCLKTAPSGGISKLVSVASIYNEILKRRPDLIEILQQPFYFDTRGQHPTGLKIQTCPIFNFHQGFLSVLYKRRYLFSAQRFPEVPKLTEQQIEALDLFEEICNDPNVQLSFYMEPGDLQIANNFSVLHSRTKYQDHSDPKERRHLLRIWLTLPNGRPLPAVFEKTREFRDSYLSRLSK